MNAAYQTKTAQIKEIHTVNSVQVREHCKRSPLAPEMNAPAHKLEA